MMTVMMVILLTEIIIAMQLGTIDRLKTATNEGENNNYWSNNKRYMIYE